MLEHILFLCGGLAVLIASGEFLVRGAVGIAKKFKVAPMVIGLTVVAFGTSTPELLVSVQAALVGSPEIAIGNVLGSNIVNVSFILGLTALILPLKVERSSVFTDWPVMMIGTILFGVTIYDLFISRVEGIFLILGLVVFVVIIVRNVIKVKKNTVIQEVVDDKKDKHIAYYISIVLVALAGMYFGADFLLKGAVGIARHAGMSEHIIGVTVVAVGTSVPELVASVMAAIKKQADISIGNLLGSNIFNIGAVLGGAALVNPIEVNPQVLNFDFWCLLVLTILLFPLLYHKLKLHRWKGGVLFLLYVAYVGYLVNGLI
jgi:cation:H+ antiporter